MKRCPKCDTVKEDDEYHKYFSKDRNKYRTSNYCKPCSRLVSNINAKKNYKENKVEKLEYAKEYRAANQEKIKAIRPKYRKRQINELQNCYVRELLISKSKFSPEFIKDNPEVLETKRLQIKLKRKIKTKQNA